MNLEPLLWAFATYLAGYLCGSVFGCSRKHAPNPETFALDLSTDPGEGAARAEPPPQCVIEDAEVQVVVEGPFDSGFDILTPSKMFMVSVPALCDECYHPPSCAKCGKEIE